MTPDSVSQNARMGQLQRANLPLQHSARRQSNRERIHARAVHPIDTPRLIPDPLERRESRVSSALSGARLLVAAVALHGLVILSFVVMGNLLGKHTTARPPERLTVNIVESPRPEPPAIETPLPVKAPLVPEFEPITPPKKVETKPKVEKYVDTRVPETEAPPPSPRRVVGLNLESTVAGNGPAFAIGTSRLGQTDTQAKDPAQAQASLGVQSQPTAASEQPAQAQRLAAHIPTRDTAFEKPKRLAPTRPEYPATLKAQSIEGDVIVQVDIAADGRVTKVGVVRSSGHAAFDAAAKQAAAREHFGPAMRDGNPVAFTLTYSYRFRIED